MKTQKIKGVVKHLTKKRKYERDSIDIEKVVLTLENEDDKLVFLEVRNKKLADTNLKDFLNKKVEVEYYFEGSINSKKLYNNIILHNITLL